MPATVGLPDLSARSDVPATRVAELREKGHTVLRRLASHDEVTAYRPVIEAAALAHARETRPVEERDTYGQAFLQVWNLWRKHEGVRRFVLAERFARAAADLLGVDGVRLYHDQALLKEAGGGPTPWHQDQWYWPLDTDRTVTMWMPLVDVPRAIGTMSFASGSHRLGALADLPISDESEAAFRRVVAERGLPVDTHGPASAGDATFHLGWTLHSAPPNPTGTLRSVMTVIYFADGARVAEPANDHQRFDLRKWLPGLAPGDRAASELNPLVWSRRR